MTGLDFVARPRGWGRVVPGADIRYLRAWAVLRAAGFTLSPVRVGDGWGVGCSLGPVSVVPAPDGWAVSDGARTVAATSRTILETVAGLGVSLP